MHAGDAILTDNWHTNEVLDHTRKNFEGYTFAMRTLEAWGAMVENDHRAYYTAGGRVWVLDLEPSAGKKKRRLPGTGSGQEVNATLRRILLIDDTPEIAELLTFALRDRGYDVVATGFTARRSTSSSTSSRPTRSSSIARSSR